MHLMLRWRLRSWTQPAVPPSILPLRQIAYQTGVGCWVVMATAVCKLSEAVVVVVVTQQRRHPGRLM